MENKDYEACEIEQTSASQNLASNKKTALKRTLVSIIAFIVISVIIFSAQTVAYFSIDKSSDLNVIQSGNLEIELIEMKDENGTEVLYTDPVSVMPATSVSKIVSVRNTGSLPIYVRISVETLINKEENSLPDQWRSLISCNYNTEYWTYSDGYFYYNFILEPQNVTSPLFDSVSFSPAMGNQFMNSEIKLTVTSQATQANYGATSPLNAAGWPAGN
jgi:hypothetical protein